jgi:hypothetical protein
MTADAVEEDLTAIIPPETHLVVGGIPCRLIRLRAREVFSLARVLASGVGRSLVEFDIDTSDPDAFKSQLGGILLVALPNASEEILAFVRDICRPVDDARAGQLRNELINPAAGELFDIVDAMIDAEGDELIGLVGKAGKLMDKVTALLPKPGTGARGPEPST